MNLLLFGTDELELLTYLKRDALICGLPLDNGQPVFFTADTISSLDFKEAYTFAIFNPKLGEILPSGDMIDFYLSPVILYRRPYLISGVMTEARLDYFSEEPSIKKWYKRIAAWCRKKGTPILSWKGNGYRNDYPKQFYATTVNTRYAFPKALKVLKTGTLFCERKLDKLKVEEWLSKIFILPNLTK